MQLYHFPIFQKSMKFFLETIDTFDYVQGKYFIFDLMIGAFRKGLKSIKTVRLSVPSLGDLSSQVLHTYR